MQQGLIERELPLARIDGLVKRAAEGRGACMVVRGQAGIGKTALLDAAAARCRASGLTVLRACGDQLLVAESHALSAELIAALLDEPGAGVPADVRRDTAVAIGAQATSAWEELGPAQSALIAIRRLVFETAAATPLALIVDDAHWADEASAAWMVHLATRLRDRPVLLLLAVRSGDDLAWARLDDHPDVHEIALRPLSADAITQLLEQTLGTGVDPGFAAACHEASGGLPFLAAQLAHSCAEERIAPTAEHRDAVATLAPVGIARASLVRVAHTVEGARSLARAVSILGPDASPGLAARLAGLTVVDASQAVDALEDGGLLAPGRPLTFVHPLVGSAISADTPGGERARLHGRAARLLSDSGAPAERVATHLARNECLADPWAAEVLLAAARSALRRGAPGAAMELAARALAEPPPPQMRVDLQLLLGVAALRADRAAQACAALQAALALSADPLKRGEIAVELSVALLVAGRAADMARLCDELQDELTASDPDALLCLRAYDRPGETPAQVDERLSQLLPLDGNTRGERLVLAALGHARAAAGSLRATDVAGLLAPALMAVGGSETRKGRTDERANFRACLALGWCEDEMFDTVVAKLPQAGSRPGYADAYMGWWRADRELAAGRLDSAATHARCALEVADAFPEMTANAAQGSRLVLTQIASWRGCPDDLRHWAGASPAAPHLCWPDADPRLTAALLARAEGRFEDAAELLIAHGDWCEAAGWTNPAAASWCFEAIAVLHLAGRASEAFALAERIVRRAESFGAPTTLARALLASSVTVPPDQSVTSLERAAELADDPRYAMHRILVDHALGAALRRDGRRARAREPLRRALDGAIVAGAHGLAEIIREELDATGARVRRERLDGVEALTPAECRVAGLAAGGCSNREIARRLFVTLRTVEMHLTSVYAKLGIGGRPQLADALGEAHEDARAALAS